MEIGQGNSESTTVTQKILREEDGSGVLPGASRGEVCTMGLSHALSFCPKSRKMYEFQALFWVGTFIYSILAACQNRSYFLNSWLSSHDIKTEKHWHYAEVWICNHWDGPEIFDFSKQICSFSFAFFPFAFKKVKNKENNQPKSSP